MAKDKSSPDSVFMYDLDENVNHFQCCYVQKNSKYSPNSNDNQNFLRNPHLTSVLSKDSTEFDSASNNPEHYKHDHESQQYDMAFAKLAKPLHCLPSEKSMSSHHSRSAKSKVSEFSKALSSVSKRDLDRIVSHTDHIVVGKSGALESYRYNQSDLKFQCKLSGQNWENHSEAGPDVAHCIEEEFKTASSYLHSSHPGALDSLYSSFPVMSKEKIVPKDITGSNVVISVSRSEMKEQEAKIYADDDTLEDKMKQDKETGHEKDKETGHEKDKETGHENDFNIRLENLEKENESLKQRVVTLQRSSTAAYGALDEITKVANSWSETKDQYRIDMTSVCQKAMEERDQALEDLKNVESAFADLHRRYEHCKTLLEKYKENEDQYKKQCAELQEKLAQQEEKYEMLRAHSIEKLESAHSELENVKRHENNELAIMRVQLKKAEMRISGLEKEIEQKTKENTELSTMCDDLIAKVGRT